MPIIFLKCPSPLYRDITKTAGHFPYRADPPQQQLFYIPTNTNSTTHSILRNHKPYNDLNNRQSTQPPNATDTIQAKIPRGN
jgi:hypothetical protein